MSNTPLRLSISSSANMKKLKQMTLSMPVRPAPMGPVVENSVGTSRKPNTRHSTKPTRSQAIRSTATGSEDPRMQPTSMGTGVWGE